MGPFQMTVLQSASFSWIIFVAAGPLSRPIQPSGIASEDTTWVLALASKASATRISFGKMRSQPFSSASFMASLAVWMKSSSTSDVPTALPWALRKVKGCELIFPNEILVADAFDANANTQVVSSDAIPDGWMGLDNGPAATKMIQDKLADCKTVIWNGPE